MNISKLLLAALLSLILASCSENGGDRKKAKANNDHMWKSQTRSMEKAREVERVIMDAAKQRREQIDQQDK